MMMGGAGVEVAAGRDAVQRIVMSPKSEGTPPAQSAQPTLPVASAGREEAPAGVEQGRPEDERLMEARKRTGKMLIDGVEARTSLVNQTLAAFAEIVDGAGARRPLAPPAFRAGGEEGAGRLTRWTPASPPGSCRYDIRDRHRGAPHGEIERGACPRARALRRGGRRRCAPL